MSSPPLWTMSEEAEDLRKEVMEEYREAHRQKVKDAKNRLRQQHLENIKEMREALLLEGVAVAQSNGLAAAEEGRLSIPQLPPTKEQKFLQEKKWDLSPLKPTASSPSDLTVKSENQRRAVTREALLEDYKREHQKMRRQLKLKLKEEFLSKSEAKPQ